MKNTTRRIAVLFLTLALLLNICPLWAGASG